MLLISTLFYFSCSSLVIGSDGTIYIGFLNLYAINPNGTLQWKFTMSDWLMSSPAIGNDGTIFVGCTDYKFYAINPNGTLKWTFSTNGLVESSAAIGNDGTVYFSSDDDNLYAIITDCGGLANSPWPKFHKNNQNTGRY